MILISVSHISNYALLYNNKKGGVNIEIDSLLAKNIKIYRNRLGYTQERLAEECSLIQEDALVNRSFISDIENCRRNIALDKIGTLAKALKVEPYELFLSRDIGEKI